MAVPGVSDIVSDNPESPRTALDLADIRNSLASVMWRNVGIVRSGDRLRETGEILDFWGHYTLDKTFDDAAGWEMQNKLTVARIIAMCALARSESIGVHYRRDASSDAAGNYHTTIERNAEGTAAKRAETWPG
jgi:L-aspartate oxidase